VDTDHIFHELFRDHSEWLRELTGLPLPPRCRGMSLALKQMEIRWRNLKKRQSGIMSDSTLAGPAGRGPRGPR